MSRDLLVLLWVLMDFLSQEENQVQRRRQDCKYSSCRLPATMFYVYVHQGYMISLIAFTQQRIEKSSSRKLNFNRLTCCSTGRMDQSTTQALLHELPTVPLHTNLDPKPTRVLSTLAFEPSIEQASHAASGRRVVSN